VAHLDDSVLSGYGEQCSTSEATRRAIIVLDYLTRFALPLCSAMGDRPNPDTPVSSVVIIVDIGSFSMKQAWSIRWYGQNISKLLATCFPEVVDKIYVNAPWT
jgi:hypothetical protein